jgi:hypothetical protein
MPVDVDERGGSAARRLLDNVSSEDTAAAWVAVRSGVVVPEANAGRPRRGWILVAAAAVVVVVGIAGVVVVLDRRADSVATVNSGPSSTASAPTNTGSVPSTTAPVETLVPSVDAPMVQLDGVWMAGPDVVWALVNGRMVRSLDGGLSWLDAGNPNVSGPMLAAFLDGETGWITAGGGLMVTRDGGASWQPVDVIPDGMDSDAVMGLAAHDGRVYLTLWSDPMVTIGSSPADHDEWTATQTDISVGIGQSPHSQFGFSGSATFFVHTNQGNEGALRVINGEWTDWSIGCAGGSPELFTSGDAGDVAILCGLGPSEPRDSPVDGSPLTDGRSYLFVSGDDGTSFTEVAPPPAFAADESGHFLGVLAHPDPATFVVNVDRSDGTTPVYITHDNGSTWSLMALPSELPVGSLSTSGRTWLLVTHRLGGLPASAQMWVSDDAGATWTAVDPTSAPSPTTDAAIGVSYLDPPPLYEPQPFAQIDRATESIALGDGFVVAGNSGDPTAPGQTLIVLDLATGTSSEIPVDQMPRGLLAGPGPVVYGEALIPVADQPEVGPRFVAIALAGDRAGDVILEQPSLGHAADPISDTFYEHSADGVIDLWNAAALVTPYLDQNSQVIDPPAGDWPARVSFDYEASAVVQAQGPTWPLTIERHPDAPSTMANQVAAGANGTAVYATWIGPRNGTDIDYSPPTQPVIAALIPDGTGTWYQLPEGWWVTDSNTWGTLLTRIDGNITQLAWFHPTSPTTAVTDEQTVRDYLSALAVGHYDTAAQLLASGSITDDERGDLRPLFHSFPDLVDDQNQIGDLAAALRRWCQGPGLCAPPDEIVHDGDGFWVATYRAYGGSTLTAYLAAGVEEGRANVRGLPPRRSSTAEIIPCPDRDVRTSVEADLDGDNVIETVTITQPEGSITATLSVCNTPTRVTALTVDVGKYPSLFVVDDRDDGTDEVLLANNGDDALGVRILSLDAGRLGGTDGPTYTRSYPPHPTGTPGQRTSFGCETIDGSERFVAYAYRLIDGDSFDSAARIDIDVLANPTDPATAALRHLTYQLPGQLDEATRVQAPRCAGFPLITIG